MFGFVRDVAGAWADGRFVRANRVLRSKVGLLEAANARAAETNERLRARRQVDRDLRVQVEQRVGELTRANLNLSALVSEILAQRAAAELDRVAVAQALSERKKAAEARRQARRRYLAADAAYRVGLADALIGASGPEYVRKAEADKATAELRAERDAAEVAFDAAEDDVRDAELWFRAAMGGGVPADGGERA